MTANLIYRRREGGLLEVQRRTFRIPFTLFAGRIEDPEERRLDDVLGVDDEPWRADTVDRLREALADVGEPFVVRDARHRGRKAYHGAVGSLTSPRPGT